MCLIVKETSVEKKKLKLQRVFSDSLLLILMFPLFISLFSISESFLTVKGAALFLPRGNGSSASSASRFSQLRSKHAGEVKGLPQEQLTVYQ